MDAYLYVLRCADGSYYIGMTRSDLEKRLAEHEACAFDGYTARR
jgi:putative endonuclease